jgi:adenosyl cobinamide kinase/adenosyl cobinamide phosphate guanylyltransferase
MALILLVGGARSGKSALAVNLASISGRPVTFVATAEARDPEMAERIARHRAARPKGWRTVEEPVDLRAAVVQAEGCLVVDCLSLWVANLLDRGWSEDAIEDEAGAVATLAAARVPLTVAVTNEVGLGIVPSTPLGRSYRDLLGRVNAAWVASAAEAAFVVAGRLLPLSRPEDVFAQLDV